MQRLTDQRIRYLIEHGGLYPTDEPATKNFVIRWVLVLAFLSLAGDLLTVVLRIW